MKSSRRAIANQNQKRSLCGGLCRLQWPHPEATSKMPKTFYKAPTDNIKP